MFQDANEIVKQYTQCQLQGSVSRRHELPYHQIMEVEYFDI